MLPNRLSLLGGSLRLRRAAVDLALLAVGLGGLAVPAGIVDPTGEGPFPQVHGEMVVDLPSTPACTTHVVEDAVFADTSYGPDGPFIGTYTPTCSGRWSKVVLTLDASVEKGRQYDRVGGLQIGGVELLHFSTPVGTQGVTTWQIQRDVTQYASLLEVAQPVWFQIGNATSADRPGIFHGSVSLDFYGTSSTAKPALTADLVIPLNAAAPTDRGLSSITEPGQKLASAVTLPRNLTQLTAEVFASGHGHCEEHNWWLPIHCPGHPYREVGVYVDGILAGIAPVFPTLYTGGWGDDWWRPVPGPRALNMRPYTVDLTPFVGTLTDDLPHEFGVAILGFDTKVDGDHWLVATNLLATVNHQNRGRTHGAVISHTGTAQPTIALTGEPSRGGTYVTSHKVSVTGWTQVPGGQPITQSASSSVDATQIVLNVVKSEWHWTATGPAGGVDATYELVSDGVRFALVDKEKRSLGTTWIETYDQMQTYGPLLLPGVYGHSLESWIWRSSDGRCVHHELVASLKNILVDTVKTTCPVVTPPIV